MGIFIGNYQSTSATKAALKINYAVRSIINPAFKAQYPVNSFTIKQVIGIDRSEIRAARTGIRNNNDIVWVGRAANYAAKLTACDISHATWITEDVYSKIADEVKLGGPNRVNMWSKRVWSTNGNKTIYGSDWWWEF